jgi:hypothetical protein
MRVAALGVDVSERPSYSGLAPTVALLTSSFDAVHV